MRILQKIQTCGDSAQSPIFFASNFLLFGLSFLALPGVSAKGEEV